MDADWSQLANTASEIAAHSPQCAPSKTNSPWLLPRFELVTEAAGYVKARAYSGTRNWPAEMVIQSGSHEKKP